MNIEGKNLAALFEIETASTESRFLVYLCLKVIKVWFIVSTEVYKVISRHFIGIILQEKPLILFTV